VPHTRLSNRKIGGSWCPHSLLATTRCLSNTVFASFFYFLLKVSIESTLLTFFFFWLLVSCVCLYFLNVRIYWIIIDKSWSGFFLLLAGLDFDFYKKNIYFFSCFSMWKSEKYVRFVFVKQFFFLKMNFWFSSNII
jgi:hypothetical protein